MVAKTHSQDRAFKMFSFAEAYSSAGVTAAKEFATRHAQSGQASCAAPPILLLSFALELYLKCLFEIRKKPIPQHHDLKKLFDELRPADRLRIRSIYRKRLTDDPQIRIRKRAATRKLKHEPSLRFNDSLKLSAKTFVHARYPWDAPGNIVRWYAGAILNSVRMRILELKPSFSSATILQ